LREIFEVACLVAMVNFEVMDEISGDLISKEVNEEHCFSIIELLHCF